ncbi:MAG TPA: beta-L-arabinofuranosidase domain-containing protein [Terriglobia bacterium]|nr:beta-L-arabinofuranosidase domain-containing protein [Terriglobia bacterium]
MMRTRRIDRREFISTAAATVGAALVPGAMQAQDPFVDVAGKSGRQEGVNWKVVPFPMSQVRLRKGPFMDALEADRRYLLMLPQDRLLHTFRVNAGLASSAVPFGGWESPDCELRGHFTGGHYLSACALMYASTGDEEVKKRGDAMVAELAKCQAAARNGYLSAFPLEFFDRLREGRRVWAPFYTYHKIMAGHLDMYVHCGNQQALEVAEGMAGWVRHWQESISDEHMQRILQTEFGGMNEVLLNLYAVTGKRQYMELAKRFEKSMFLDPLADHRDELKGIHANTHIPQVIGAARRYELTGEHRYRDIASYFWEEVTNERSYCTGGTSNEEYWRTPPGKLATELGKMTEECCCGYNMLKLTRHIFAWTADPRTMDYFERTLYNSRLGTQNPEDGMMSYFLPLGSGYWKYFNTPYQSFWCCTGTGVEEFAKTTDTIYFHDDRGIYVNLFIPSEVNWREKGVRVEQETRFPEEQGTTLVVRTEKPVDLVLNIRIPYWVTPGGEIKLNGESLAAFGSPSSYLALHRNWKNGDRVEVRFPMGLHIDAIPDDPTQQAVMFGPLVLAGRLGQQGLTKAMTYSAYDTAPPGDPVPVPAIAASPKDPLGWIKPVADQPLTFRTAGQSEEITLVPLNRIFGERYAVYWKTTSRTT